MTKKTIDYQTRDEMNQGKTSFNAQGMRSLHTDFINNDEKQGYRVTFVNGIDDPNNAPELIAKRVQEKTNQLRKEELQNKPNITLPEMQELLRLSL